MPRLTMENQGWANISMLSGIDLELYHPILGPASVFHVDFQAKLFLKLLWNFQEEYY